MSYFDPDNDADYEMAALTAAGNAAARGRRRMLALRAAGDLAGAARSCHHGWGYPTNSPAATNARDPRAGTPGFRCLSCGSWFASGRDLVDLRGATADAPCELEARS